MGKFIDLFGRVQARRRARRQARARKNARLHLEHLEDRCVPSGSGYRPIDEVGNNVANPNWGAAPADQPGGAAIQLLRNSPVAYADGISAPSLPNNPSARLASDLINNQADPNNPSQDLQTVNQQSLSDFGYAFGQFIDHDMDLTPDGGASFPIPVSPGDPIGPNPLPFTRSQTDPNTGTSTTNPLQQINAVTSYLDLSQVYGSSQVVADALRLGQGGLLQTSPGNMLPYLKAPYFTQDQIKALNMQNASQAVSQSALFATGDVRGNENIELTALQTLFVRNHNLIAGQLQQLHPTWSDEQLYQEARKLNIAEYQSIIYNEYLPTLLGPDALPQYTGYKDNVNVSIATEFSTVAFRFGHSMLNNQVQRQDNNGQNLNLTGGASISLAEDFFDPNLLNPSGTIDPLTGQACTDIDPVLKGDADGHAQAMDVEVINAVRNLLFANGQLVDQDLIARDVQRARDDGIGTYNQVRVAYGLPAVTSFAQITSNVQVQNELQAAYGNVNNIDPFEGGLAEDHVAGSTVGPLFQAIMVDQFTRLRDGDRFFYQNEKLARQERTIVEQGDTLAKVIEANTQVTNLQSNVFLFQASISGRVVYAPNGDPSHSGVSGIAVELMDGSGHVVATTTTGKLGYYSFNQLSGPAANPEKASGVSATGNYSIVVVLPSGFQQTTPNPQPVLISAGGTHVTGVDFGIAPTSNTATTAGQTATTLVSPRAGRWASNSAATAGWTFAELLAQLGGSV
jgi:hypothetical protein